MIGKDEKISVLNDGGGFRAAYGVGINCVIWKYFKDQIVHVGGVSAGALNSAKIIESGSVKPLEIIWTNHIGKNGPEIIFQSRIAAWRLISNLMPKWLKKLLKIKDRNALFNNEGLKRLAEFLDIEKVVKSPIRLDIVVTDEKNFNQTLVISNHDMQTEDYENFRKFIIASASLMGAFEPITIDDRPYSDGLSFDIESALNYGCTTIFVVYNNHIWLEPIVPPNIMTFDKRTRRISNVYWGKMMELYVENLMRRYPDLILARHDCLPQPLIEAAEKAGSRATGFNRKLIFIGPTKIIPTLYIMGFLETDKDIIKAIAHGKEVAEKVMRQLF